MPNITKALKSFGYAFKGVTALFRFENNAKIHLILGVGAIALGFLLDLSAVEWTVLTIQIAAVMAAEAFNTALEKLCDVVSPEHHPLIGSIKDMAAGAVLIMAISSVVTGLLLFVPKILEL